MPVTPNPSKLDSSQVLQHAFDDNAQALRVNTEATVIAGAFEVAVDHNTDSIKIGDGTNLASVNNDGSFKVSNGLVKEPFDFFTGIHTDTSSIYTYKMGGAAGSIVAVVTILYTDSTKNEILSLSVS